MDWEDGRVNVYTNIWGEFVFVVNGESALVEQYEADSLIRQMREYINEYED